MKSLGKVLALLGAGTLASVAIIVMSVTEQMGADSQGAPKTCALVAQASNVDFAVLRGPVAQSYLKAGEAWDQEQCNLFKSRCNATVNKNKCKPEALQKIS